MTDHKHLKARVRARMAKTGERYAAARANIVGDREGAAPRDVDDGRRGLVHLAGGDAETTGFRILLANAGIPAPSDPLTLVVGGGIGIGVFAFHYEKEGFSSFFVAGRHRWDDAAAYLAGLAGRLRLSLRTAETTSRAAADRLLREALDRGPVIGWVDAVTLGTRGQPMEMAGGGYHTLVVHSIDDAAGTALVSDLSERPIAVPLDVLAAARARIAKQRNRLAWLEIREESQPSVDIPAAVRDGLRATVEGLRNPRTRNFSLDALTDWSSRLRGGGGSASWARVFPPGEWRWTGLAAIHDGIEHSAGGGLGRGRFATGLREAATVLGESRLNAVADRYETLAGQWSALAAAALPENIPLLRRTREQQDRRAAGFHTGEMGPEASPSRSVTATWRELEAVRAEARAAFPMSDDEAAVHLAALADMVDEIHAREVDALAALDAAVAT